MVYTYRSVDIFNKSLNNGIQNFINSKQFVFTLIISDLIVLSGIKLMYQYILFQLFKTFSFCHQFSNLRQLYT